MLPRDIVGRCALVLRSPERVELLSGSRVQPVGQCGGNRECASGGWKAALMGAATRVALLKSVPDDDS